MRISLRSLFDPSSDSIRDSYCLPAAVSAVDLLGIDQLQSSVAIIIQLTTRAAAAAADLADGDPAVDAVVQLAIGLDEGEETQFG